MAPPVYEPDEVGVEPEVRMGRVCDEDSQAQRHDSVSSVERNVLAVDPGPRSSHDAAKKGLLWGARTRRLGGSLSGSRPSRGITGKVRSRR